jgi:glycosyltransferase involved in cell wall biosynthesis
MRDESRRRGIRGSVCWSISDETIVRILQINDFPITAVSGGGAELILAHTVELLRNRGIDVMTFTAADLTGYRRTPLRYVDNQLARNQLRRALAAYKPDAVHLHNYYHHLSPGILAELARFRQQRPLRIVMTAHDFHLVCPNPGGDWFPRGGAARPQCIDLQSPPPIATILGRRWDQKSELQSWLRIAQHVWNYAIRQRHRVIDLILCPSRVLLTLLAKHGLPVMLLPHAIAPGCGTARSRGQKRGGGPLRMIFAGRVEPEKGLAEFISNVPGELDWTMTIVGDGGELNRCRELASQLGLQHRIRMTGRLSHEETLALIADSHLLVLPSRCAENQPMSLIEALAAGTNILVAGHGGMLEVVQTSGVGYVYEINRSNSLAMTLAKIINDYKSGALNKFDVSAYLHERSEARYLDGLLRAYGACNRHGDVKSPAHQAVAS